MSTSGDAAQQFVEHMLRYTSRLVSNITNFPEGSGVASGILVATDGDPLLLTAGHIFDGDVPWTLETSLSAAGLTLHLGLRDLQFLMHLDFDVGVAREIDLAWATISRKEVKEALESHPAFAHASCELPLYQGPLTDTPTKDALYGYAAWNRVELHEEARTLLREASFEIEMCFTRTNEAGLYEFSLARTHRGHDYYQGASGAPIADEEGRIVALVVGGDYVADILWGVPLSRYSQLLPISGAA